MHSFPYWAHNTATSVLEYHGKPLPEEEGFAYWCQQFCREFELRSVDLSIGADRGQFHFQFANNDYLLCLELACDALWIEGANRLATNNMFSLYQHLSKDTLVQA